jgi:MOSC domain-containing protein YiiM
MAGHQGVSQGSVALVQGRLESIQISNGGVPKRRVDGPIEVGFAGLAGDRQRDLRFHGGPDRAVCLFSHEIIQGLRGGGHPIDRGTTGENLTLSGVDWSLMQSGLKVFVGEVLLEITKAANPCRNIAPSFSDGDFSRISVKLHPGNGRMYARVLVPGTIRAGDPVSWHQEPAQQSATDSCR